MSTTTISELLLVQDSPLHGVKYSLEKGINRLVKFTPYDKWNDKKIAEFILNVITLIRDNHHNWQKSYLNTASGFNAICELLSYNSNIDLLRESFIFDSRQFEINCKTSIDIELKRWIKPTGKKMNRTDIILGELKKFLITQKYGANSFKF